MKRRSTVLFLVSIFLTVPSCSLLPPTKSMLAPFDGRSPLTQNQLDRDCDLGDTVACRLNPSRLQAIEGAMELPRLPIAQGLAPQGSVIFSALLKKNQSVQWFLFEKTSMELRELAVATKFEWPYSNFFVEHMVVRDLDPQKKYELLVASPEGTLLDHRYFQTSQGNKDRFTFALVSCADDSKLEQKEIWSQLMGHHPQMIFTIGDNVYVNSRKGKGLGAQIEPNLLWERYAETRSSLQLFREAQLVPILATWDDNDYGMGDGDETYAFKDESRNIFEIFFPSMADNSTIFEGPGVARAFHHGGQIFLFMDNRTFRSPNGQPAICKNSSHPQCRRKSQSVNLESTHFGSIQESWALGLVKKHNGLAWLISGDQWFGAYHPFESYEGNHPQNFQLFLEKLNLSLKEAAKEKIYPSLIFASGDRHLSEIMAVKPFPKESFQTFEITSSPIHSGVYPDSWKDFPNPRQLVGVSGAVNYSLVETSLTEAGMAKIKVRVQGLGDKKLFERDLELSPIFSAEKKKIRGLKR